MEYNRIYNFSSGPAVMPVSVLEQIRDELLNYGHTGMSVMEMSHRSQSFLDIKDQAIADLRKLMNIPDQYKVMFIQGGATLQFAMIPWNLMRNRKATYIETGAWSKKAIAEAKKYGEVTVGASSAGCGYARIPDCSNLDIAPDTDYVYICENETIHGVTWPKLPDTKGHVLVSDQSSMFLSKPCCVTDYGMIYAGVQKNVGPAGMVIVIMKEDLIPEEVDPKMPVYLKYATHADTNSGYNTPNCWSIYCCGLVIRNLLEHGGLEAIYQKNQEKAKIIYDFLDNSTLFRGKVNPEFRSLMNIPFTTGNPDTDADVVASAVRVGLSNLKGHPSVGGLRASVYNAMPIDGARALVEFLQRYELTHRG